MGEEFYDLLNSWECGLHPTPWLDALGKATGAQLRAELAEGANAWERLWPLLCTLALSAPRTPDDAMSEAALRLRAEFPDIKDPHSAALAKADRPSSCWMSGLAADIGCPVDGWQLAGEPLVAHGPHGSRFPVVAPFGFVGQAPDHWYTWDIDSCWITVVVGADAALSPCAAGMTSRLLAPELQAGFLGEMLQGSEPRELSTSTTGSGTVPAPSPNRRPTTRARRLSTSNWRVTRS